MRGRSFLVKTSAFSLILYKSLDIGEKWYYNIIISSFFVKKSLEVRVEMPKKQQYYKVSDKLTKTQILTIPNMLSFFRIALVPVIVALYFFGDTQLWTILVLIISGVTDIVDGFIARHCNMTSDFGKMIDPVADKLTQFAVLICLIAHYPWLAIPLAIMGVKEIGSFILRLIVFKKTEKVESADWHGKATTVLIYSTLMIHLIWEIWARVLFEVSMACAAICTLMMVISCTLYSIDGVKLLKNNTSAETKKDSDTEDK